MAALPGLEELLAQRSKWTWRVRVMLRRAYSAYSASSNFMRGDAFIGYRRHHPCHLSQVYSRIMATDIPPGLLAHGRSLRAISEWARKALPSPSKLKRPEPRGTKRKALHSCKAN